MTCLAAFHNSSRRLPITEREGDKRGDGLNLWKEIKTSVCFFCLFLYSGEMVGRGATKLSAAAECTGDSAGQCNMEELN